MLSCGEKRTGMDLFSWYKIASLPVTPSDVETILVIMCPRGMCTSGGGCLLDQKTYRNV